MYPPTFVPHFPYINLKVCLTLWRQSMKCQSAVFQCWPHCINSFLVSPPLVSLSLDFVSSKWLNLVCLGPPGPGALGPLWPSYRKTVLPWVSVGGRAVVFRQGRNKPGKSIVFPPLGLFTCPSPKVHLSPDPHAHLQTSFKDAADSN